MNNSLLTTARYEFLHGGDDLSSDTRQVILDMFEKHIGYPAPDIQGVTGDESPIGPLPEAGDKTKIAICIGHARPNDSGAVSVTGINEETFNNKVAIELKDKLDAYGIDSEIISYYDGGNYGDAMRWLAKYIMKNNFTHAIELHFNSSSEHSSIGYEYLFWHTSTVSDKFADVFQQEHKRFFPNERDRGVEPLGDQAHERGVLFCKLTHCPAIICEPFFGSNSGEVSRYMTEEGVFKLASMYASALKKYAKN